MRRKVTEQNDFLKKNKRKLKPFFSVSLCILRMMMMKKLLSLSIPTLSNRRKKWFQKADNYATLPLQRTLLLLPSLLNAKHDTDEEELLNQTFF